LREEHRLKMFENRVKRKIFERDRNEVTEQWRGLHNDQLYDLYFSPNIIAVIKYGVKRAWHVARMAERELHTGLWCRDLRGETT
jgi:hypothetical protein